MNTHRKKMIAPVAVTILFLLICAAYGLFYIVTEIPLFIRVFVVVVLIALGVAMIATLIARIKEIKGGEEDDLNNY